LRADFQLRWTIFIQAPGDEISRQRKGHAYRYHWWGVRRKSFLERILSKHLARGKGGGDKKGGNPKRAKTHPLP